MKHVSRILAVIAFVSPAIVFAANDLVNLQEVENLIVETHIPGCKNPETDFDSVYCHAKIYFVADDVLNTAYQAAKQKLDTADQAKLRGAQTAWRTRRDKACITTRETGDFLDLECAFNATLGSNWFLFELEENPRDVDQILDGYYEFIEDI